MRNPPVLKLVESLNRQLELVVAYEIDSDTKTVAVFWHETRRHKAQAAHVTHPLLEDKRQSAMFATKRSRNRAQVSSSRIVESDTLHCSRKRQISSLNTRSDTAPSPPRLVPSSTTYRPTLWGRNMSLSRFADNYSMPLRVTQTRGGVLFVRDARRPP